MKNIVLAVVLTIVVGFIACSTGPARRFGEASGSISEAAASAIAAVPTRITDPFLGDRPYVSLRTNVTGLIDKALFRMATSPISDCKAIDTGNTQDMDRDGIPVDANYEVDCGSSEEKLSGKFRLRDENDSVSLFGSGMFVDVQPSKGYLLNNSRARVDYSLDTSSFSVKVNGSKLDAEGSAAAELKTGATSVSIGFEGSAAYSGSLSTPKEGDSGSIDGFAMYYGTSVPQIPDTKVVGHVLATFTMGVCQELGPEVQVKTGEATFEDGAKNKVRFAVTNCEGVLTYNGKVVPIKNRASIRRD